MIEASAASEHDFVRSVAAFLLQAVWQDALLAVAAYFALCALTRASAALRHNVAMGFLCLMLIVPASTAAWLNLEGFVFLQSPSAVEAIFVLLWLVGAVWMFARFVASLHEINGLENCSRSTLPEIWRRRANELQSALGIFRAVSIRFSGEVVVPCSARVLRPIIWLPLSLLTSAPVEQIEALLAHEMAHVARKDWLWNGLQYIIESLLFFHPAVWLLGRRIRQEREQACDDLAIEVIGNPVALAEALAILEYDRQSYRPLALAACGGRLRQRITRLVSDSPARQPWLLPVLASTLVACLAISVPQSGLAGGRLPEVNVESSIPGALGPGDYRDVVANEPGKLRHYRVSKDSQGRATELYTEDGRPHPIDAEVRRWLVELTWQ